MHLSDSQDTFPEPKFSTTASPTWGVGQEVIVASDFPGGIESMEGTEIFLQSGILHHHPELGRVFLDVVHYLIHVGKL